MSGTGNRDHGKTVEAESATNLEELEATLPWGLHDAYLERLQIDWPEAKLVLDVRVMITEHQDMDQRARITITGLVFCSVDPPEIDLAQGYEPTPVGGLWIDSGVGPANEDSGGRCQEYGTAASSSASIPNRVERVQVVWIL